MKQILGFLMLLLSLQVYAGTASLDVQAEKVVDVKLDKGNSDNEDRHPRTLIPITCVYTDGMVQLTFLSPVGEYALIVTNQVTGERWSISNTPVLQTSTVSGTYWVEIETEDGSMYYGTYTL